MNVHATPTAANATPALPSAAPESIGLSLPRLQKMSEAFQREIDKGTTPGVVTLVARRGKIGWFEAQGKQAPGDATAMSRDTIFRIYSMTKPLVSLGIMMLVEDGHLLLNDPLSKFIPDFADVRVGIERNGALEYALPVRPITIQDLLRHTSGLSYEITGQGMVQRMYAKSDLRKRDITNEEHARLVAKLPLMAQPGTEWNYSRSTDILGRVIEVISGQTLGRVLEAAHSHAAADERDRLPHRAGQQGAHRATLPRRSMDRRQGGADRSARSAEDGIRRRRPRLHHHGLCALLPDAAQRRHARRQPPHRPQDAGLHGVEPSCIKREGGNASATAGPRLRPRLRRAHR